MCGGENNGEDKKLTREIQILEEQFAWMGTTGKGQVWFPTTFQIFPHTDYILIDIKL